MSEPSETIDAAAVAPGDTLTAQLAGDTLPARLDALFARHFAGTELAGVTRFWNAVHAFKEDVKRLLGEDRPSAPSLAPAPAATPSPAPAADQPAGD